MFCDLAEHKSLVHFSEAILDKLLKILVYNFFYKCLFLPPRGAPFSLPSVNSGPFIISWDFYSEEAKRQQWLIAAPLLITRGRLIFPV